MATKFSGAQGEVGITLRVASAGLDNLTALSKGLADAGVETSLFDKRAAELAGELAKLQQQQALIDQFRRQKQAVDDAGAALVAAKQKAGELGREMSALESPTAAQQKAFDRARQAARQAADAYQGARVGLQELRPRLAAAGVATDDLAAAQVRVRKELSAALQQVQLAADWGGRMAAAQKQQASAADAAAAAAAAAARGVQQQGAAAQQAAGQTEGLLSQLRNLTAIDIAARLGGQAFELVKDVAATSEAYQQLAARISLVTGEGKAQADAMAGIAKIAKDTNTSLEATGQLFMRVGQAAKEMGLSQQAALQLTETINKAVQLGGESAQSSQAAITQLNQALQSGVLRGEEFNSIMEQAPALARALAAGLQVPVGALRQLAQDGRLTSDVVVKALQSQRDEIDKNFSALPQTVGRAVQNLKTQWEIFVGTLASSGNQSSVIADGINLLANNLDRVAGVATRLGAVLTAALAVEGVAALRAYTANAVGAAGATELLTKKIQEVPKVLNIVVAATGLEVGYEIGRMLYENSDTARKLGVALVGYFEQVVNGLILLKDVAARVFTGDGSMADAVDAFKARVDATNRSLRDMWADTAEAPSEYRARVAAAAEEQRRLGDGAAATGRQVAGSAAQASSAMGGVGQAAGAAGAAMGQAGETGAKAAATANDAFAALLGGLNKLTPAFVASTEQQAAAVVNLVRTSAKATQGYVEQLRQAIGQLSGEQLAVMSAALQKAFVDAERASRATAAQLAKDGKSNGAALAEAERSAALLKTSLAEIGVQAAQSLGVDVVGASSRVGAAFRESAENFDVLIRSLPALKASGVDAATVVGEAINKMIDGAKNQAELDAIGNRLKAVERGGLAAGAVVSGAWDQVREKSRAMREQIENSVPGVQSLSEAARRAGVEVGLLTTGVRDGFRDDMRAVNDLVAAISRSGTEAARASPILSQALNKQLEAARTKEEVELVRQAMVRAAASGKQFGEDAAAGLAQATAKAQGLRNAYAEIFNDQQRYQKALQDSAAYGPGANGGMGGFDNAAQNARNARVSAARDPNYDKEGWRVDGSGQRLTAGAQLNPPDNSGDWEFVSDASYGAYQRAESSALVVQGLGYWRNTKSGHNALVGGSGGSRAFAGGGSGAMAGSRAAAGVEGASTTHVVTVNLSPGDVRSFNTASAADSDIAVQVMKAFERAAQTASVTSGP